MWEDPLGTAAVTGRTTALRRYPQYASPWHSQTHPDADSPGTITQMKNGPEGNESPTSPLAVPLNSPLLDAGVLHQFFFRSPRPFFSAY